MPSLAASLRRMPYANRLGMRWQRASGEVSLVLPYRRALLGNASVPALHGGIVAALIECGALSWCAAVEQLQLPALAVIDVSVDYLRSPGARDTHAACEIVRAGRRVIVVEVRCWQADAVAPVASGRVHVAADRSLPETWASVAASPPS